jgi:hypothetical protein
VEAPLALAVLGEVAHVDPLLVRQVLGAQVAARQPSESLGPSGGEVGARSLLRRQLGGARDRHAAPVAELHAGAEPVSRLAAADRGDEEVLAAVVRVRLDGERQERDPSAVCAREEVERVQVAQRGEDRDHRAVERGVTEPRLAQHVAAPGRTPQFALEPPPQPVQPVDRHGPVQRTLGIDVDVHFLEQNKRPLDDLQPLVIAEVMRSRERGEVPHVLDDQWPPVRHARTLPHAVTIRQAQLIVRQFRREPVGSCGSQRRCALDRWLLLIDLSSDYDNVDAAKRVLDKLHDLLVQHGLTVEPDSVEQVQAESIDVTAIVAGERIDPFLEDDDRPSGVGLAAHPIYAESQFADALAKWRGGHGNGGTEQQSGR